MSRMQYQPRFLILALFFIYLFFNGSILDNSFQIRVEIPKRPQVFCLFPTSIIEIEIPLELLLGVVFFFFLAKANPWPLGHVWQPLCG